MHYMWPASWIPGPRFPLIISFLPPGTPLHIDSAYTSGHHYPSYPFGLHLRPHNVTFTQYETLDFTVLCVLISQVANICS